MKTNIVILLIVGACNFLFAQPPAPDFSVTDADGVFHQLYADHLDQGQTVVLKLFFINCPPCATYAPHVQQLYEDWGEGEYDVEFFELSILNGDSNAEVAVYQDDHNLTFPGVGGDGGSVPAVAIYKNGTYGPYYGTPTFVVIAPDGEVTYDPSGPGVQGTIDAIDAAISATGAEGPNGGGGGNEDTIPVIVNINVNNISGSDMTNVDIYMKSENSESPVYHLANSNGQFTFEYPSELAPEIENPVVYFEKSDGIPSDDVSTFDIVTILRHTLALDPFNNPFFVVASDVNSSGSITANDLFVMRQMVLGLILNWSNDTPTWKFIRNDCNFGTDPFGLECQEIELINPTPESQTQNINVTGVKVGNVN